MPRIDPRLVTIMVSAVILSTLLVATLTGSRGEESLLVLGNEYPEAIVKRSSSIGIDSSFSFTFMATHDFEKVVLRFSSLWEKDLGMNLSQPISPMSMDIFPSIDLMGRQVALLGGEAEIIEETVEIDDRSYDATIIDFSRFLEVFTDSSMLSKLPLTFVILVRDDEIRYFEGYPCFFMDAPNTLEYLTTSRNEEKQEYFRAGRMLKQVSDISSAPLDGVLVYQDVARDERFSVAFNIDIPEDGLRQIVQWYPDVHVMELVRGYVDGELETILIDVVPRGLEG